MRVLKALLARACIPLCFIQILKFESGQIMPSDVLFLQILVTFTTVWMCDIIYNYQQVKKGIASRLFGGCTFTLYVYLAFFMTHNLFQTETNTRNYLLIDYGFPCLRFGQLLQWTSYEIWCLTFFIYNYLKAVGFSPMEFVSYLSYLSMHAVIVIFILDFIYTVFLAEVNLLLYDNFMYTFDVNTTEAYPEGYLDPLKMDTGLYDKATMKTETYSCATSLHSSCLLTEKTENAENKKYPFTHNTIYRYIGEDVEMRCVFSLKTPDLAIAEQHAPVWYFNDSVVYNYSRHSFHTDYNPIGESVNVFSYLKIRFLRDFDFGEYICSRPVTIQSYKLDQNGGIEEEFVIHKPTLNVFLLRLITMEPKLIYRFVGNLIASEYFFLYNSDDDINDMSVVYTINDKPVDEVCPGFQTQVCSLGASILRTLIRVGAEKFDWDGEFGFPFIEIGEMSNYGLKRGILYFCLCSSGFGIHRMYFLRKLNTGLRQRRRNEEISHPFVFIVLPQSELSFFRFQDDTHLYTKLEKLVQDETNFDVIEDEVKDIIEFVKANEEKVFTIANLIQTVLLVCFVIFFYILTLAVSNIYMGLFIVYVPGRVFFPQPALPDAEPLLAIEQYEYDIFLSYAEEEDSFVTEELVPFLEGDCNLRTCIPRRDFPPNRSIFGSFVDKIQKSRKVIVILSESYMTEARCIHLQLEHIILPSLYEHIRNHQNILVLKYDKVPVPELLRWNFHIEVYKWYELLPLRVKLQTLRRWFYFGHI